MPGNARWAKKKRNLKVGTLKSEARKKATKTTLLDQNGRECFSRTKANQDSTFIHNSIYLETNDLTSPFVF